MNKKQRAFFQPYSQSLQITNRLLSLTSKFPDFVLSWISSISRVYFISSMAIIQSFFKGICFYQGYLEVLWLTLLSMLSYIVPWGSFVSTLWMLLLYYMIRGILQLTVAKIKSFLNRMWCRKGLRVL